LKCWFFFMARNNWNYGVWLSNSQCQRTFSSLYRRYCQQGSVSRVYPIKHHSQLRLRTLEHMSANTAGAFKEKTVSKYFSLLGYLQFKYKFRPSRVLNVDETGVSTVPNKSSRVIGFKGKRRVSIVSSPPKSDSHRCGYLLQCCRTIGCFFIRVSKSKVESRRPEWSSSWNSHSVSSLWIDAKKEMLYPVWLYQFLKSVKLTWAHAVWAYILLDTTRTQQKSMSVTSARKRYL
jgi:hypothetical protein